MFLDSLMKLLYVWVILLLICNAPIRGLNVLCVGESGHMELESAWSACCTADARPTDQYNSELCGIDNDCGSCVDVAYRLDSALRTASNTNASILQIPGGIPLVSLCNSTAPSVESDAVIRFCFFDSADATPPIALRLCGVIRC